MPWGAADIALGKMAAVVQKMADKDILVWLDRGVKPSEQERYRAATIVADRLCGAVANPIIRNAQGRATTRRDCQMAAEKRVHTSSVGRTEKLQHHAARNICSPDERTS